MMHRPTTRRRTRSIAATAMLLWAIAVAPPAHAQTQPDTRLEPADALRERLFEQRSREAEAKQRAAEAFLHAQVEATPNQAQYDVHAYDLTFDIVPSTQMLYGTAVIRAEVLAPISTMELDLKSNMTVSAVTAGGSPAPFVHDFNHILIVTLDRTYNAGETVQVSVTYSGNPFGQSFRWDTFPLGSGPPMIWTLSEPYGARDWWPCKNVNTDKADSLDLHVTVPDNLIVGSNGLLVSDVDNGTTRTFHWRSRYPIAPYLVSLAIHPYATYSDWYTPLGGGAPMEVKFFVFPAHLGNVAATYALTVPMMQAFAAGFGEYPFVNEKYGHAEFIWGGAMEHQTLTSTGTWNEDVIAHELAHQWWGDLVTCADFHHVWLNEGFATWAEAYWHEQKDGIAAYHALMKAATYYGPGTVIVEDPLHDTIFDANLSYNKGSWVLHMLRGVVGDPAFFAGLAAYRAQYGYGTATTEQFRDVMEAVSGKDLHPFFQQWIYGQYVPVYRPSWTQNGGTLELTIEQAQTTGLFTMPIPVRITTTTGTTDVTVQNSQAFETYAIGVTGTVLSVALDPDNWVLSIKEQAIVDPTFDHGILLVNGVSWPQYGALLTSAYEDRAFWGDNDISFWDVFNGPAGGYPSTLPPPLGHGMVPADTLKLFSSVIWVGDNLGGDLERWLETSIGPYLDAGGNVLLMSRMSKSFLDPALTGFAGVTWAETNQNVTSCSAAYPGLVNMPIPSGGQNQNDLFATALAAGGDLLFTTTYAASPRGLGVHRQRPGGGTVRAAGGHLVHFGGRPYRYDHTALRANAEFALDHFFGEPWVPLAAGRPTAPSLELHAAPNPLAARTAITFTLPRAGPARLAVYDAGGRLVRTLADGAREAGTHRIAWDGTDGAGRAVAPGAYFMRLEATGAARTRSIVVVR